MRYLSLCLAVVFVLCASFPSNAQNGVSIVTTVDSNTLQAGEELYVSIDLNLYGALSLGGYIDIQYDPTVFRCVEVDNADLFGRSGGKIEACSDDSGLLRITSMAQSMSEYLSFAEPRRYAVVVFQALQATPATEILFAGSSQIFGTRGGDILVQRDDSVTQQIMTEVDSSNSGTGTSPPGTDGDTTTIPEPSTLALFVLGIVGLLRIWRKQKK